MPPDGIPEPGYPPRRVTAEPIGSCPVCRNRFRGKRHCPRCGADLARLMWLAVRAWQRRGENSGNSE